MIHSAKLVHQKKKKVDSVMICQAGFNGPRTPNSSSPWIFGHSSQISQVPSNSSEIRATTSSSLERQLVPLSLTLLSSLTDTLVSSISRTFHSGSASKVSLFSQSRVQPPKFLTKWLKMLAKKLSQSPRMSPRESSSE